MKNILLAICLMMAMNACQHTPKESTAKLADQSKHLNAAMPKPKVAIKTVGILLYDNYAVLDAMGPYHVFSELMGTKVFFVGRHNGLITTGNGMKIQCDSSINEVKQLDILVIPGGLNETYTLTKDTTLLNWIRKIDARSKYTTSVCTGAWILAATGLLKNKPVTTHWFGKQLMKDQFGLQAEDKRYVQSGKYFTSAGVSAGIDMSLAVIKDIMGEKYTQMVMLDLEYDPQPPVKGGSEHNTDKTMVEEMRSMYSSAMRPLLHPEEAASKPKIVNSMDPVCGMALGAGYADTVRYQGKLYGFCSERCRQSFKANPASYTAAQPSSHSHL